jgi:hypothetical protein
MAGVVAAGGSFYVILSGEVGLYHKPIAADVVPSGEPVPKYVELTDPHPQSCVALALRVSAVCDLHWQLSTACL